jgi:thiamine-phosphate pyrophosphorylase
MLVTDRRQASGTDELLRSVDSAIAGGVTAVQLREKDVLFEDLLPLARQLRGLTSGRAQLLVNGPVELAVAVGADGVHLPEGSPPIGRPELQFLVGRSVHSREAAETAWAECSDYLIAGPVFETESHPGQAPAGVALISAISQIVAIPVLAIGGVTADRVESVVRAGASGVAVISAILGAESPRHAAHRLRQRLEEAWAERSTP